MEIYFCENCAKRVVDVELDRGEGRRVGDRAWCKDCVEHSPGYEARGAPPDRRAGAGTRSRTKTGYRLATVGARSRAVGRKTAVSLGAALGFLVIAVAVMAALSGSDERASRSGPSRSERDAVRPSPRPLTSTPREAVPHPSKLGDRAGARPGPSVNRSQGDAEREALREAVARADELARQGDFDGAERALRSLLPGAAKLVYEELAAAKVRVRSNAESKVNAVLEEAGRLLSEGKTAEALASVEALQGLRFAGLMPMAPARVEEVRERIAEAQAEARAAAERREAELLEESIAEFEKLVAGGEYVRAGREAERQARDSASESISGAMKAASRVALALQERRRLVRLALTESKGRTVSVGTKNGLRRGELADVDDEGLALVSRIVMNGRETDRRTHRIAWNELTVDQERRLIGDLRRGGPDERIAEALVAIASEDAHAAEVALDRAGEHALAARVRERVGALRVRGAEGAAGEAWSRLVAEAGARGLGASRAQALAEEVAAFEARFGETQFAASRAVEIARLQARLAAQGRAGAGRGLVALYTFGEGEGTTVHDTSGVEPLMDLRIESSGPVRWLREETDGRSGIEIASPAKIIDTGRTSKIFERLCATNEITIEAHFQPANLTQGGPVRIVSFSKDTGFRNFTLGQHGPELIFRLRTTATGGNGCPSLDTQGSVLTGEPIHVAATFSKGLRRFYLNGRPYPVGLPTGGDFSNWEQYRFLLGSEVTGTRAWLGRIFRVAIYDRALDEHEVRQSFEARR